MACVLQLQCLLHSVRRCLGVLLLMLVRVLVRMIMSKLVHMPVLALVRVLVVLVHVLGLGVLSC